MPKMNTASFQIPVMREPRKGDIIIFLTTYDDDDYDVLHSFYDGSTWSQPAADTQYGDSPVYVNSEISLSVVSITLEVVKATYLTSCLD